jgi:hypothetical protein
MAGRMRALSRQSGWECGRPPKLAADRSARGLDGDSWLFRHPRNLRVSTPKNNAGVVRNPDAGSYTPREFQRETAGR